MHNRLRLALLATATIILTVPASGQDGNVDGRVTKLEKEMRAVQRQVFPNGAGKFLEPDIKTPEASTVKPSSTEGASDILTRVDALEGQLASLTNQVEKQGNSLRTLEARLKALESQIKAQPLSTSGSDDEADAAPAPVRNPVVVTPKPAATTPKLASVAPKATPTATKPSTIKPTTAAKPSAKRTAAVAAVAKPSTGNAAEDSYMYGANLWEAKFYPEAQAQLQETIDKYPKYKRLSRTRNLLGRAWLDDGKPATAVKIFYDNYKNDPRGERAADSLLFLGYALADLDKPVEACGSFDQLVKAYPAEAKSRLADRLAKGRARAKCS